MPNWKNKKQPSIKCWDEAALQVEDALQNRVATSPMETEENPPHARPPSRGSQGQPNDRPP